MLVVVQVQVLVLVLALALVLVLVQVQVLVLTLGLMAPHLGAVLSLTRVVAREGLTSTVVSTTTSSCGPTT